VISVPLIFADGILQIKTSNSTFKSGFKKLNQKQKLCSVAEENCFSKQGVHKNY
jgi:hypothetical protein